MKRLGALLIAFIMIAGYAACAGAESARIETGSGSLNMRAKANSKSTVIAKIPNGTIVEVAEEGETWSAVIFKGKTGYVKSQFLTPYSEEEEERRRQEEEAKKELLPNSGFGWIETESGSLNIRKKADSESDVVGRVPNGVLVETQEITKEWSRIAYKGDTGYVKTEYLNLPYELEGEDIFADDGYVFLRSFPDAKAQSLAVIRADQPMTVREMTKEWVHVSCFDEVRGEISGFVSADDVSKQRRMPGEGRSADLRVNVALSTGALKVGEEMTVTVTADAKAFYRYLVYKDGKRIVESAQTANAVSGYRPREAGSYRLEVVAYDQQGRTIGAEAFFTVSENPGMIEESEPYSQKDGWWLDKKYSKRNLDSSGCAIFTLSHALHMLGHTGDSTTPQALAKTYPMYLAESGTVTARLLAAAGRDFGFSTQEDKIKDAAEITRLLKEGTVFSFSVADGHIALAAGLSEDGTKVRVLDSAPSATFERIKDSYLYVVDEQGNYQVAVTLWDIPGAKYYFETDQFGGLEYYMDLSYVAGRGVRPIKPKK